MIDLKPLQCVPLTEIHTVFLDSFSDYDIPIDLPFWKFRNMYERRGIDLDYSMGVFIDNKLSGFILNGIRMWEGKTTVYDSGTGVVPEHRRKGYTKAMFTKLLKIFQRDGIKQYLLEVLQSNTGAFELYKKSGFKVTRKFSCYQLSCESIRPALTQNEIQIENESILSADWDVLREMWDFNPSWQNSIDSVLAVPESFNFILNRKGNMIQGYAVIHRKTGDIPQIAVHPDHRGKGIGSCLISALPNYTEAKKLGFINVEKNIDSIQHFLVKIGFTEIASQYEMLLEIDKE
ncbi:MAG: GNAT family N-acetyltransferase [Spirochaetales bacterium]|nr:GNAT family N-acetyltransferase [Spirochaetales bacterium]